jgi:hypothetical protein
VEEGFTTPASKESVAVLPLKRVRDDEPDSPSEEPFATSQRLSPRRLDMDASDGVVLGCDGEARPCDASDDEQVEPTQKYEPEEEEHAAEGNADEEEEGELAAPAQLTRTVSEAL